MAQNGIAFENVTFAYGAEPVLQNFNLTLPEHGVLCLSGPSGCGKTTLLRLLAGLETLTPPNTGRISGLEGKRVSIVFQEDRLASWMTARENVAAVLRNEEKTQADLWLEKVGMAEAADELPAALSGGMKRRVAIARALAFGGDFLLLDEPFTGLDEEIRLQIAHTILETYRNKLVVLVTHIEEEAQALGADVIRLNKGGIIVKNGE